MGSAMGKAAEHLATDHGRYPSQPDRTVGQIDQEADRQPLIGRSLGGGMLLDTKPSPRREAAPSPMAMTSI